MNPNPPENPQPLSAAETSHPEGAANALHAAVWFGAATLFNVLAGLAAFDHDGLAALRWGALAMAAVLVATGLRRRQRLLSLSGTDRASESLPVWAAVSPAVVSLLGSALSLGVFAGVAYWTTRGWRGLDVWGGFYLWRDGAIGLAALLGLLFLALGAWLAATSSTTRRATGRWAPLLAIAAVLLGPGLVFEKTSSSGLRALYIKRSPAEAFAEPWADSVVLEMKTVSVDGQDKTRTCVVLERGARLLWAWQRPVPETEGELSGEADGSCGERVQWALESGAAAESALLRGDLDGYFAKLRNDPELVHRPIALEPARLPPGIAKPLLALLTVPAQWNYTPFDLALAARRPADARATMPDSGKLTPHQRQGLFHLGMADLAGPDAQVLAEQQHLQQLMLAGQADISDPALRMMMMGMSLQGSHEAARGVGGFSGLDYLMANRHCDLRYAAFLQQRGIAPHAGHAVHLVSLIGRAQYPGLSSEFQNAFPAADESLGLPDASQLPHCVELARFYGSHVKDLSAEPSSSLDESPLRQVYRAAADAVFQWCLRDAETWRKANGIDPRVHDVTVVGAPEIAVEAAHAMIAAQPVSFDQYCHWANHWYTWMLLANERRPQLTRLMREMAQGWARALPATRQSAASCSLSIPWNTNEFEGMAAGMKLLNADLRRLGLPCQAVDERSVTGAFRLACKMAVAAADPQARPRRD